MPYKDKRKQLDYQNAWMQKRRAEWFFENGPCVTCGSWLDLEADHIKRDTKVDHRIWSWAKDRRLAELAKCQALCRKCHEAKTAKENTVALVHGISGYRSKGCRCKVCRKANATWCANYRAKFGRKDYATQPPQLVEQPMNYAVQ